METSAIRRISRLQPILFKKMGENEQTVLLSEAFFFGAAGRFPALAQRWQRKSPSWFGSGGVY
jgi:hypothetical protein